MNSDAPWEIEGVRRPAREAAHEAARRSGISIGEWLDRAILDAALREGVAPKGLGQPCGLDPTNHGLAEMRAILRSLTPAESLLGVARAVQQLSQKIDLIGGTGQDPAAPKQLEDAIVVMRGVVSHLASNDALAKLSREVRALAGKIDQAASRDGGCMPCAFKSWIAKLLEKLDAADARLNHLEAIERRLELLRIHLECQRGLNLAHAAAAPAPEVDALARDVAELRQTETQTRNSLDVIHGTLGHVIDRLAMIEPDMRGRPLQPPDAQRPPKAGLLTPVVPTASGPPPAPDEPTTLASAPPVLAMATPPSAERRPIELELPPHDPRPPGSAASFGRGPDSPMDHIAATGTALGEADLATIPDCGNRSTFIAAARHAAQAAVREVVGVSRPREIAPAAGKHGSRVRTVGALIGGATAVLTALGALQMARTLLSSSGGAAVGTPSQTAHITPDTFPPPAPPASPALAPADRQPGVLRAVDGTITALPASGGIVPIWMPRQPPQAAVEIPRSPGGWDGPTGGIATSAAAPAKRKPAAALPTLDLATSPPAQ